MENVQQLIFFQTRAYSVHFKDETNVAVFFYLRREATVDKLFLCLPVADLKKKNPKKTQFKT